MGKLLAGAAKCRVTPSQTLFDKVIAEKGRYSYHSIKGDVYVRAAVLSDGTRRSAIIVTDLSVYPLMQRLLDQLEARFQIPPEAVVVGGTRGHNAFSVGGNDYDSLSEGLRDYTDFVHSQTLDAVAEAIGALRPARIGAAYGRSGIAACREYDTPLGTIEACNRSTGTEAHLLPVVRIEDREGKPIAVLVSYAMHACALSWNQFVDSYNEFDGDFAARVTRFVEKAGRDQYPVMWACGGCSEQAPAAAGLVERLEVDEEGSFRFVREVLPPEATLMLIKQNVSEQGLEILRVMDSIRDFSDEYDFFAMETTRTVAGRVPFARYMYREKNEGKSMFESVRGKQPGFVPEIRPAEDVTFRLRLMVVNGVALASSNAEVFSTIIEKVRALIPCPVTAAFDACFGNSAGSICDAANEEEGVYGLTAWGSKVANAREGEEAFLDGFRELAEAYRSR